MRLTTNRHPLATVLTGPIINQFVQADTSTLRFRVDGGTAPADLEIVFTAYVYQRLELAVGKMLRIELRKQDLHVIPQERRELVGRGSI